MKCGRCLKREAVLDRFYCEICKDEQSARAQRTWKQRKKDTVLGKRKLCLRCNVREIAEGSTSRCENCLEYARNKAYEYRTNKRKDSKGS